MSEPSVSRANQPPMSQGVGHAKRFSAAVPSLQRRKGRGADEVAIATRLAAAKTDENPEAERAACLELARLLDARGLGLGSAAELLARASEILADADTFRKLSALEERLGRPARAADALARSLDLDPQPGARVRLGWLLLRAGEPGRAASAFVRAASESPEALAMELHGSLSFGGAREVSKEEGAGAYLDAAARRATAGQLDAELDDLARALALSPSPEGAERMARALERRDRAASADAFLESFVLAMPRSPERAEAARALREARLSRGDVPGALVMALAEGRSAGFDESFDELLLRAGLPELLAEHLGMCARRSPTEEERVRYLTERMRLYAGVLASPERALAATAELLALVPHHAEALARLSAYAEEGVVSPSGVAVLVERLARGEGLPAAFGAAVARLGETTDNPALVAVALRASLRSSDDAFARTALASAEAAADARIAVSPSGATVAQRQRRAWVMGVRQSADDAEIGDESAEAAILLVERALAGGRSERAASLVARALDQAAAPERSTLSALALRAALSAGGRAGVLVALAELGDPPPEVAPLSLLAALEAGDDASVARAADVLRRVVPPATGAALARVAARAYLAAGDGDRARAVVLDAPSPGLVGHALLVEVLGLVHGDDASAENLAAIERAAADLWPSAERTERLMGLAYACRDAPSGLAFGRRLLGLRPGDTAALGAFLECLVSHNGPSEIAETIAWILSLPYDASTLATVVTRGLGALESSGTAELRMRVARRAFDVVGAMDAAVRGLLVHTGKSSKEFAFSAMVLERALSCGEGRGEAGSGYLALADLYALALDADGEVRALATAIRDGAEVPSLEDRLDRLSAQKLGGDAEIALLDVLASRAPEAGPREAALALRRLGAALWDLAGDRAGAVAAWVDAARRAPFRASTTLRRDLVDFAGHEDALECLLALAEHEPDPARSGSLLAEAAHVAVALRDDDRTFDLASRALHRNPAHTDALASAEAGTRDDRKEGALSSLYSLVASRALGRFGRRAAHYRAARFFEARGAFPLAVEHATSAFLAVPSEGSAFQLLARAGERAGDPSAVFQAVDRLAGVTKSPQARAAWLVRAAETGEPTSGVSERADALLRAFVLLPDPVTLDKLARAIDRQLTLLPQEADLVVLRFGRAARAALSKGEGPDAARVAVRLASLAVDLAQDLALAWDCVERAFSCDGDIDEYRSLSRVAPQLAEAEGGRAAFGRAVALSEQPYSSLGAAAFAFLGRVASAYGEGPTARKLLVTSAVRDSDDDESVVLADEAIAALPDAADEKRFVRAVGPERLAEAHGRVADADRQRGDKVAEHRRLERAAALLGDVAPPEMLARLAELTKLVPQAPVRTDDLFASARASAAAGDRRAATATLERILATECPVDVRVEALRELGLVNDDDPSRAEGYLVAAFALAPSNDDLDAAIESAISLRGDFAALAEHLGRRVRRFVGDATRAESLRILRLRRAALLEQRLGLLAEAKAELEALLEAHPGHASALRYLADLLEKTGDLAGALRALERLSALVAEDVEARTEVDVRIARVLLAEGKEQEARTRVEAVLARAESLEATELLVELARRGDDPRRLGDALARLARLSPADAEGRSEILVESAQAAARAGDVDGSIRRAQEAARVAPHAGSVQLFARGLEYRTRGAGAPDEARATLSSLQHVRPSLMPADVALRAFLMAEAQRAIPNGPNGLELLLEARVESGPHPLLSLGIAERLAAQGRHDDALVAFDEAIVGPLLGMRRTAEVRLAASVSAERIGDLSRALAYAEGAVEEPELRLAALERVRRLALAFGDVEKQRQALRQLVAHQSGDLRLEASKDLAGSLLASPEPAHRDEGRRVLEAALADAPRGRAVTDEIRAWLDRLDADAASESPPPTEVVAEPEPLPEAPPSRATMPQGLLVGIAAPPEARTEVTALGLESSDPFPEGAYTARDPFPSAPPPPVEPGRASTDGVAPVAPSEIDVEAELAGAEASGSILRAERIAEVFAKGRPDVAMRARRLAAELAPGDTGRLDLLARAAAADNNASYVRALEHLSAAMLGASGAEPPPLANQIEQPGVLALLTRPGRHPVVEAFGIVWEYSASTLTRGAPPLEGASRIVVGGDALESGLVEASARLLGLGAPRLLRRIDEARAVSGARAVLGTPPQGLVLARPTCAAGELAFAVGCALAASLPQYVVLLGHEASELRTVFRAMLGAFGPPEAARDLDRPAAMLGEALWQTLPARAQRRLSELLGAADLSQIDAALAEARLATYRVGLFVSGDFREAARAVLADSGMDPRIVEQPAPFVEAVNRLPSLTDLYRLAMSPTMADARFAVPARTGRPGARL
ncbi:MAG: hypothetical protein U0183_27450 [Polyangiaceae bacterium]